MEKEKEKGAFFMCCVKTKDGPLIALKCSIILGVKKTLLLEVTDGSTSWDCVVLGEDCPPKLSLKGDENTYVEFVANLLKDGRGICLLEEEEGETLLSISTEKVSGVMRKRLDKKLGSSLMTMFSESMFFLGQQHKKIELLQLEARSTSIVMAQLTQEVNNFATGKQSALRELVRKCVEVINEKKRIIVELQDELTRAHQLMSTLSLSVEASLT